MALLHARFCSDGILSTSCISLLMMMPRYIRISVIRAHLSPSTAINFLGPQPGQGPPNWPETMLETAKRISSSQMMYARLIFNLLKRPRGKHLKTCPSHLSPLVSSQHQMLFLKCASYTCFANTALAFPTMIPPTQHCLAQATPD